MKNNVGVEKLQTLACEEKKHVSRCGGRMLRVHIVIIIIHNQKMLP